MPEFADRLIYGALAYLKTDGSVTVHAGRQGLYVIRATGSSASITNAEGFAPRAFGPRSTVRRFPTRPQTERSSTMTMTMTGSRSN